jgi:hypothetical protein
MREREFQNVYNSIEGPISRQRNHTGNICGNYKLNSSICLIVEDLLGINLLM